MEYNTLAWIDLESTGVDSEKDSICQIAAFISDMNLNRITEVETTLVNPGVPIPASATEVHGITNEMVANAPTFAQIAQNVYDFINTSHFAGYNVVFDIRMLLAHFSRCNIAMSVAGRKIFDPLKVLQKLEPRDQSSVYKKYTGEELDNAHDAVSDILATHRIAVEQLKQHSDILTCVNDMYTITEPENTCDLSRKIVMKDGVPVFNFGPKTFGKPISEDPGFLQWMLKNDFPVDTKEWINNYFKQNGG